MAGFGGRRAAGMVGAGIGQGQRFSRAAVGLWAGALGWKQQARGGVGGEEEEEALRGRVALWGGWAQESELWGGRAFLSACAPLLNGVG